MKCILLLLTSAVTSVVAVEQGNPLGKVFELLNTLKKQIIAEGEHEEKTFQEFKNWCDTSAKNLNYEIDTGKQSKAKLSAKITELASNIEVAGSKIDEGAGAISSQEKELEDATAIRKKESSDFVEAEKELVATVDTLDRAVSIISSQMAKNPAALAQIDASSMTNLLQSLSVVVDAAGFNGEDQQRLLALVQDQDSEMGAPSAAAYKSQSGGVLDLLQDLKDKADTELAQARKAEANAKHNYSMVKQSLENQVAADKGEMADNKAEREKSSQDKAIAEGDLEVTLKDLKTSEKGLGVSNNDCMTVAGDHEATVASRKEELKVLATAHKTLEDSQSAAFTQAPSLLQMAASSKMQTRADLANTEVLRMVKKLAQDHHSSALAQLASRIAIVARYGSRNGADPFAKVKGLVQDMIAKLEKEAESEATEKAYCDEQMAKTEAKKSALEDDIEKMSSKIGQAAARSAALKEDVAELQTELAKLSKNQAQMDANRRDQQGDYSAAKQELTKGLTGVRKALGVLRDYYGGAAAMIQEESQDDDKFTAFMQQPAPPEKFEKSSGAGGSIIDILEVVESDIAKNLAKEESQEADSSQTYEEATQENKVSKEQKEQDVKYKTKEAASLDKAIADLSSDKDTASTELSAVMEYYGQLKARCVAKPESYEERTARRAAEIEGLKEALSILENEAAFVQSKRRGHRRAHFMGAL